MDTDLHLIPRQSAKRFAGERCQYLVPGHEWGNRRTDEHQCDRYGRYAVGMDGHSTTVIVACGQHLADMVRRVWIEGGHAAIVQEVPGMWHEKRLGTWPGKT